MALLPSAHAVERRLGTALVALVQAAVLLAAPLADPPPAPLGHRTHLAEQSDAGCRPVHDDFECRICSVATASALAAAGCPATPPPPPPARAGATPGDAAPLPGADRQTLHARAPPRS